MNDNAALNLIKNIFENSFDRERFLIFAKNLFHFLDTETFIYRGNLIPDAYDAHIKTLERIGKYEDIDGNKIEVLAVCLNKQSALERARTMQRNFIAWYLNGSRGGVTKDAALVAFYAKDSNDWRLSLVKMDYHLGESKAGKIKAITELTPARRFSFLVGASENTHTAQKQLLPIIKDTEFKPRLSDFESAFSVEVVTKDFFEKYKKLFLNTKDALDKIIAKDEKIKADFQEKNIEPADFAKKLLGQIVFLYFLQKKGWFGVPRGKDWNEGDKGFLRNLFLQAKNKKQNYFNKFLEPLFYEALAIERPKDYYAQFDCKIPFLNGGLFDPINSYDWQDTDILLPNEIFSNPTKTKEGDAGDGILDVFDRYNFTVKEDEPLEREVAVDPEMLGKVFENLLEVKDRKSKGTYYTPREIVHYMCQESLINYLLTELNDKIDRDDIETLILLGEATIEHDSRVQQEGKETKTYSYKLPEGIRINAKLIDDKLKNVRVCDPAVGSGAFLVGMMTEIIRVRNILTNYISDNRRSIYDFKRHAIQNCLYGVDIDPGAVEIAKLRLWLSLIVDEEDIKQIKPLPNLDYKIMQGNSLLEEYEGIKLFDEGIVTASPLDNTEQIEEIKQKLSDLQREFFKLHSTGDLKGTKKQQIELELKRQNDFLTRLTKTKNVKVDNGSLFDQFSEARQKADELKKFHHQFFEKANKREKDEIKKKIETLEWDLIETTLREQNKLSLLPDIEHFKKANIKPFFLWKLNFSEVFEKNGGFDVVIANPPYKFLSGKGSPVQELLNDGKVKEADKLRKEIDEITENFPESSQGCRDLYKWFIELGSRLVKTMGTLTYITPNTYITLSKYKDVRKIIFKKLTNYVLVDLGFRIFDAPVVPSAIFISQNIESNKNDTDYTDLKEVERKMLKISTVNALVLDNLVKIKVIDGDLELYKHPLAERIYNKANETLEKYLNISEGEHSLKNDFSKRLSENSEQVLPVVYDSIIEKYKPAPIVFLPKNLCRKHDKNLHSGKRFFIRKTGDKILATIPNTYDFAVAHQNLYVVKSRNEKLDVKFFVALLSSKLLSFLYQNGIYGQKNRTLAQFRIYALYSLPVPDLGNVDQKTYVSLLDRIYQVYDNTERSVANLSNKDIGVLEYKINQLVYKLYDLTPEEIKVIENEGD